MFGLPVAVAVVSVVFVTLLLAVAAGGVLNLFIRRQEPITVVPTRPPANSTAWLSDGERPRDTPDDSDTRPFRVLTATMRR